MTDWAAQFVVIFLSICVLMLGAIVVRVLRSLERAVRAIERLAEATRGGAPPGPGSALR